MSLIINVDYDEEAQVWVVQSDTIPLVTEADTFEILNRKLPDMIQDVLLDNDDPRAGQKIDYELVTLSQNGR